MSSETNTSFDHPIKQRMDGIETSYGVHIKYTPEDDEIKYVVAIAYIASIKEDYHCRVDRKQVFINGIAPNKLIDQLAARCMDAIYPIDFLVNPFYGIKEVLNFEVVKERWQTAAKALKREYKGDVVDQYFEQIDQTLVDQHTFFNALKREMFYNLIFFKKKAMYAKNAVEKNVSYRLPIHPYEELSEFVGNQRVYFEAQKIHFHYQGVHKTTDTLRLTHTIHKDTFSLESVKGTYSTKDKELSFSVTALKERTKKYVAKTDAPEAIPAKKIKKKKSWFSDLFKRSKE